jgi:hypothetical protein
MPDRGRHFPRGRLAIMHDPARQKPWRDIERLRFDVDVLDQQFPLARATPQHRVDEAGIFRGAPVRLHQPHRQIDRGVIGHVHPEDLRGADQKRALRARRIGRNAAIEQPRQQMAERTEPPQNRRHQPPHQRAVAIGKSFQRRMRARAVELFVERAMLVQDAVQNVGGNPPCRETGHFGRYCESLRRHGAEMFSSWGAGNIPAHAMAMKNTFGMRICQM